MGAYYYAYAPYIPTGAALKVLPGVYDVKALSYGVKGVFTNTVPVDAYRGAGRPESIYCIERLMDYAARRAGRRSGGAAAQELHPARADAVPDRGRRALRHRRVRQGHGHLPAEGRLERLRGAQGARREAKGRLRGIGMCYYIESTMGDPTEHAAIEFTDDGFVNVLVGTQTNGQGHDTAYTQVLHQRLNVPFEKIRIVQGDTDRIRPAAARAARAR